MTGPRMFPVLWQCGREETAELKRLGCPTAVPWSLLEHHRERAYQTHDQSLERLAERGGLCPSEIMAVIEDRRWRGMSNGDAVGQLLKALGEHTRRLELNPTTTGTDQP